MPVVAGSDLDITLRLAASESRVKRLCRLAREHRLCYSDGIMKIWYRYPSSVLSIAVAYHHKSLVGSAVAYNDVNDVNVGIYVRRDYRRLGIGSRLFERIFPYACDPIRVWTGESRERFYEHAFDLVGAELKAANKVYA